MTDAKSQRQALLRMANSLRASADIIAWSAGFREVLAPLLLGVDRVSLNVNRTAVFLPNGEPVDPKRSLSLQSAADGKFSDLLVYTDPARDAQHFVKIAQQAGCPTNAYGLPQVFNYFDNRNRYLGSLVLWRRVGSPPIPDDTVQLIRELQGFLNGQFAWAVQRYQRSHARYVSAIRSAENFFSSFRLTRRQKEVLWCRLRGLTAEETARALHISEATTRRHIRSIRHRMQPCLDVSPGLLGLPVFSQDAWKTMADARNA